MKIPSKLIKWRKRRRKARRRIKADKKSNVDRDVVVDAAQANVDALGYASEELRVDRDVTLKAVQDNVDVMGCVSEESKVDRELNLDAVQTDRGALQYTSKNLRVDSETPRSDKEVVSRASKQEPTALKFPSDDMNQNPEYLKTGGLFNEQCDRFKSKIVPRIVLSTKFNLCDQTSSYANSIILQMKANPFFRSKELYFPNSLNKNTFHANSTDMKFPSQVQGTTETGEKENNPIEQKHCRRSSFQFQLTKAKETGGFMVQVAESDKTAKDYMLGTGQQSETELAKQLGVKVFRVYMQRITFMFHPGAWFGLISEESILELTDELVKCIETWYKKGCIDMSVKEVRLNDVELGTDRST